MLKGLRDCFGAFFDMLHNFAGSIDKWMEECLVCMTIDVPPQLLYVHCHFFATFLNKQYCISLPFLYVLDSLGTMSYIP